MTQVTIEDERHRVVIRFIKERIEDITVDGRIVWSR